jgi:hypothetical protein
VLAAFDEWQRSAGSDTKSNADIIISLDYIVLILVHSEPRAEPLQVFQPFTALQPIEVALPPTNLTLNQLSAVLETAGFSTPGRYACIFLSFFLIFYLFVFPPLDTNKIVNGGRRPQLDTITEDTVPESTRT